MGSTFGIEVVILTTAAAVEFVRCSYLQNFDTRGLHVAQQPRALTARALDSDPLKVSERSHQAIAKSICRKALGTDNAVAIINDYCYMQVLLCIDTTNDVSFCSVLS